MGKRKRAKLTASNADRHLLYEKSVQDPSFDIRFCIGAFRELYAREPLALCEDFCGTALMARMWVESDPARTATGVDLDPEVLAWANEHNVQTLGKARARVALRRQDVLASRGGLHDVVVALNYSYSVFKRREALLAYFRSARKALRGEGIFVIDAFGGWESQQVLKENRTKKRFTYQWHQAAYNPIDASLRAYIHFCFPDGSKMKRAFTYDWRLWQLAELREILLDAGFGSVDAYWEGEENGEGNGVFTRKTEAQNDPGWNAYLVARQPPGHP